MTAREQKTLSKNEARRPNRKAKPQKSKKNRIMRSERGEKGRTLLFLLPSLLGVLVFFVIPFCIVIYQSLIRNPFLQEFVGLDNYIRLFNNSSFMQALKNTGVFTAVAVPLAVLIPLLLALLLDRRIPGASIFRTILISPLMVPVASIVLIWQVLFDYHGAINEMIGAFGALPIDWFKSEWSILVVVLLFLWKNIGYNMILFMAALGNVPKEISEAAILDGAGGWQVFRRIKLPYLSSSIIFVAILSIINSFKVFREVYLLTGDHPYETLYLVQHFMNNVFRNVDYQKLSAAAIIMCAAVALIVGIMLIADDKMGGSIED